MPITTRRTNTIGIVTRCVPVLVRA